MTRLLEQVLERVRKLPAERQDALAQMIVDEIDSEERWNQRFEATSDQLDDLANQALDRARRGKAVDKGWDEL